MNKIVQKSPGPATRGFTLIELLVVISIIGLLAAFIVGGMSTVTKRKYISTAQSEMALIQTALDRYHSKYGTYPVSNPNLFLPTNNLSFSRANSLYFELQGVTLVSNVFTTLDGVNSIDSAYIKSELGVDGLINCSKGTGDDAIKAVNFLPGLKTTQIGYATNSGSLQPAFAVLASSVGGPDPDYTPLAISDKNPWRYNSTNPTNNPGTYDLYIQLKIGGKMYLINNWSKQTIIDSPLP